MGSDWMWEIGQMLKVSLNLYTFICSQLDTDECRSIWTEFESFARTQSINPPSSFLSFLVDSFIFSGFLLYPPFNSRLLQYATSSLRLDTPHDARARSEREVPEKEELLFSMITAKE